MAKANKSKSVMKEEPQKAFKVEVQITWRETHDREKQTIVVEAKDKAEAEKKAIDYYQKDGRRKAKATGRTFPVTIRRGGTSNEL